MEKKALIEEMIEHLRENGEACLLDMSDGDISELSGMIKIFCGIKGVKEAKATKILHKRLPNCMPVIDSRISKIYGKKDCTYIIKNIREDMAKNKVLLTNAQKELKSASIKLTILRIFDILLWVKQTEEENLNGISKILFRKI